MRCRIFFDSFFILLFCIGIAVAEVPKEVHKGCTTCHTEPDFKAIKAKVSETCVTCHPASLGRDHSIGVVPKIIPEDLPLGEGNKVTCVTCHDPHGKGTAAALLRKDFNSLCISCHKK